MSWTYTSLMILMVNKVSLMFLIVGKFYESELEKTFQTEVRNGIGKKVINSLSTESFMIIHLVVGLI